MVKRKRSGYTPRRSSKRFRPNRRKRTRAGKARAYKASRAKYNSKMYQIAGRNPLPTTLVCNHQLRFEAKSLPLAVGTLGRDVINGFTIYCNNLNYPTSLGTLVEPDGFDKMLEIYQNWHVTDCYISITYRNGTGYPIRMGLTPTYDDTYTYVEDYVAAPGTKSWIIPSYNTGTKNIHHCKYHLNIWKHMKQQLGGRFTKDLTNTGATGKASPVHDAKVSFWWANVEGNDQTAFPVILDAKINYRVRWSNMVTGVFKEDLQRYPAD